MDVEIDASLPKLKKHGRLHALRRISPLGLIRYEKAQFEGDGIVNKEIISRYLTAEVEAQKQQSPPLAVTPQNYKFKYKGMNRTTGRDVHVFEVTPRQKREGLFKGEVWIDAAHLSQGAGIRLPGEESFDLPQEGGIHQEVRDPRRNLGAAAGAERCRRAVCRQG